MGILRSSLVLRTLAIVVGLVALGGCYGRGGDTCRTDDNCRKGYVCCAPSGGPNEDPDVRGECHQECELPPTTGSADASTTDAAAPADGGDGG